MTYVFVSLKSLSTLKTCFSKGVVWYVTILSEKTDALTLREGSLKMK